VVQGRPAAAVSLVDERDVVLEERADRGGLAAGCGESERGRAVARTLQARVRTAAEQRGTALRQAGRARVHQGRSAGAVEAVCERAVLLEQRADSEQRVRRVVERGEQRIHRCGPWYRVATERLPTARVGV